jgi:hypothetical protein
MQNPIPHSNLVLMFTLNACHKMVEEKIQEVA